MKFTGVLVCSFSRNGSSDDCEAVPDQVVLPITKVSVKTVESESEDRLLVRGSGSGCL